MHAFCPNEKPKPKTKRMSEQKEVGRPVKQPWYDLTMHGIHISYFVLYENRYKVLLPCERVFNDEMEVVTYFFLGSHKDYQTPEFLQFRDFVLQDLEIDEVKSLRQLIEHIEGKFEEGIVSCLHLKSQTYY